MDNRISDFRRIRRMSLDDLAEASGLSKSTLSELERGITKPMLDSARRIARALDAYEHEIWPEDSTMPLTVRTTDTALAAAEARIAEQDQYIAELRHYNSGLANESCQQQERIAALKKALEPFAELSGQFVHVDDEGYHHTMSDDESMLAAVNAGDARRAAALLKEKE